MAVTFGTPGVAQFDSVGSGFTIPLAGVTTGQPIVLYRTSTTNEGLSGITDTFATPYTWVQAVAFGWNGADTYTEMWIGTGGAGTSGNIVVTAPSGLNAGAAVSCIGASTASGLAALGPTGHFFEQSADFNHEILSPDTPAIVPAVAGCGAVFAARSNQPIDGDRPPSPWVNTDITYTGDGNAYAAMATLSNPSSGVALTTAQWGVSVPTEIGDNSIGLLVLPAAAPVKNGTGTLVASFVATATGKLVIPATAAVVASFSGTSAGTVSGVTIIATGSLTASFTALASSVAVNQGIATATLSAANAAATLQAATATIVLT